MKNSVLVIFFLALIAGCSKKDIQTTPPPTNTIPEKPVIYLVKLADTCGGKLIISGKNFESDISKDSIFIENIKGVIDSATQEKIFAQFPSNKLLGYVKLYCNGLSAISQQPISFGLPKITSFYPEKAGPGTILTINGSSFNPNMASDSVFLNNVKTEILSAETNKITVRVPEGVGSGPVTLFSSCYSVTAGNQFQYMNKGMVFVLGNKCYGVDVTSGTVVWSTEEGNYHFSGISYDDSILYIGSSNVSDFNENYLYALNAKTGTEIWSTAMGPSNSVPLIQENYVYTANIDNELIAMDKKTGQKIWTYTATNYFSSGSPTFFNGNIYVPNDSGYLYNINASTGNVNWSILMWATGNPAVEGGTIFSSGFDSDGANPYLFGIEANSGNEKWKYYIPDLSGSSPTVKNGVVYIGTASYLLYAVNQSTGELVWQTDVSANPETGGAVPNNALFITIGDASVCAIDPLTGNVFWRRRLSLSGSSISLCPIEANGMVIVPDVNGYLHALDSKSGESIWDLKLDNSNIKSSPCLVDGAGKVYHAGDSGNQQ